MRKNPEDDKAYQAQYYAENKEVIAERKAAQLAENREVINARRREQYAATHARGFQKGNTYGREGGKARWKDRDPSDRRSQQIALRLSPNEVSELNAKARRFKISRAELIVRAVTNYQPENSD